MLPERRVKEIASELGTKALLCSLKSSVAIRIFCPISKITDRPSHRCTMRQLKHHEKKLLKKVDLLQWKSDDTLHEIKVMRRYHVQNREDYAK